MEIWGGIECTINRVGDNYFDQLIFQGHYSREEDLPLLVNLGIKKIRYPVLWEKHKKDQHSAINWKPVSDRLNYFKSNGVNVIAGLVHHGSGPQYVHMLDDNFAEELAVYAGQVAQKFPWINYYTPINEPLTTARFCGLYGLWYPHKSDENSFFKILLNECKAIVLAMEAIRRVNPSAKLIHTEDLGKTHSTPLLKYQADFENDRRWLGLDLICGRVDPSHRFWDYLLDHGIKKEALLYFVEHPMPPDILGFNYYITSERYLDEHIEHYPAHTHGGNGNYAYADVEAIRTGEVNVVGPKALLKEAWDRYSLPLAITEAHLHCSREDQLRWFDHLFQSACKLQAEGVDFRGVTAWSLLGAYGWDNLLTRSDGNYEPGVYDLRSGIPRPTALAKMIRELSFNQPYVHPVMAGKGWWERPQRIIYPEVAHSQAKCIHQAKAAPILIIGASGTTGSAFIKLCTQRNIHYAAIARTDLDLGDPSQIDRAIQHHKPWAIINAAGFVGVDDAEIELENCFLSNTTGPVNLAVCCRKHGVKFLTFSSDQVFDGKKNAEYTEQDSVNPLNIYGISKAEAEEQVLRLNPDALIIRTSEIFSPRNSQGFVSSIISSLARRETVPVANDVFVSPTYIFDLINSSLDLLIDDETKLWHLANKGTLSWSDLALEIAKRGRYNPAFLLPMPLADLNYYAARPSFSALTSSRGIFLPSLDHALDRFFNDVSIAIN